MALIGYARVSTKGQHTDGQVARLEAAGCERIFPDEGVSGRKASRPQWDLCLAALRKGDVLVVTKLDRVGRSLLNLIDVVNLLHERGVNFKTLDQDFDTTSNNGQLIFNIMASLAQWEANLIRERTIEGLAAAKVRHGGTLPVRGPSITPDKIALGKELMARRDMSAQRIAEMLGVSRATLYRHVGPQKEAS